jgi:hypothetical protein
MSTDNDLDIRPFVLYLSTDLNDGRVRGALSGKAHQIGGFI